MTMQQRPSPLLRTACAAAVALAATQSGSWAKTTAVSTAPPSPPAPKKHWASLPSPPGKFGMERHARYVEEGRRRKGEIRVLFIGDSITQLWEQAGRDVWARDYAPLGAARFGVGGENTMNILWRLQNGELDAVRPEVVVLLAGTNNLGMNTAEETAAAVGAIVATVRERLPRTRILLLGLLPKVVPGADGSPPVDRREKVRAVNALLQRMEAAPHVRYLDIGPRFLLPDGRIDPALLPDGIHPSAKGYEAWARAMSPVLKEMLGPTGRASGAKSTPLEVSR